jgi:hypothetical protein
MIEEPSVDEGKNPAELFVTEKTFIAANVIAKRRPAPMKIGYSEYGV